MQSNHKNNAPTAAASAAAKASEAIVARLPEPDNDVVNRVGLAEGNEAEVEAGVRAACDREYSAARERQVPVPSSITNEAERAGYRGAVLEAAETSTSGTPPAVESVVPGIAERVRRVAQKAAAALAPLRARMTPAKKRLRDEQERDAMDRAGVEPVEPLKRKRKWLLLALFAVGLVEALLLFAVFGDYYGLFSGGAPTSAWVAAIGLTVACLVTSVVLAAAVAWALGRYAGGRRALALLGLLLLACALMFFLALGALRMEAGQSDLAGDVRSLGDRALGFIVMVGPAAVAALLAYLWYRVRALGARIGAIEEMTRRHADAEALLAAPVGELEAEIAAREAETKQPDQLRENFEHGFHLVRRLKRDHGLATTERVQNAKAAFRQLAQLSPAQRERVVSDQYRLVERPAAQPAASAAVGPNGSGVASKAVSLALLAVGLGAQAACSSALPPSSMVVICDGTGPPEARRDVCRPAFLDAAFTAWAEEAVARPSSRFVVLTTTGGGRSPLVAASIVVPVRSSRGSLRGARRAWYQRARAELARVAIPVDTPSDRRISKSDVASALVAARRLAGIDLTGEVRLLVASDGWQIGLGTRRKGERAVPHVRDVVADLRGLGLDLRLAGFAAVTFCGLHSLGARASEVEARDRMWRGLLAVAGAPAPEFRTSCADLFPPAPGERRDGPDAAGGGAVAGESGGPASRAALAGATPWGRP